MSILKRQRELKNAEKAARKRARRHGLPEPGFSEPQPTARLTEFGAASEEGDQTEEQTEEQVEEPETEPTT